MQLFSNFGNFLQLLKASNLLGFTGHVCLIKISAIIGQAGYGQGGGGGGGKIVGFESDGKVSRCNLGFWGFGGSKIFSGIFVLVRLCKVF